MVLGWIKGSLEGLEKALHVPVKIPYLSRHGTNKLSLIGWQMCQTLCPFRMNDLHVACE